jgi:hypothetical protein
VNVERAELSLFRNVQAEIIVAGCFHTLDEEVDTDAHRHGRVRIVQQVVIEAVCAQERDRIPAQRHETRYQRTQRTNGEPWVRMPHYATSPHSGSKSPEQS